MELTDIHSCLVAGNLAGTRLSLRKGKGHIDPARLRLWICAAAGGDDDILTAIDLVCDRRSVSGERKHRLPQQLSRGFVESAEFLVVVGGSNKQQAACGDDR